MKKIKFSSCWGGDTTDGVSKKAFDERIDSKSINLILFGMRLWTLRTIKCSITLIEIHYGLVDLGKPPPSIVLLIMLLKVVDCAVIVQWLSSDDVLLTGIAFILTVPTNDPYM